MSCNVTKDVYLRPLNQGGEGEVVGQLSCIYETITTKIFLFNFLNFQTKINFEKKIPSKRKIPLKYFFYYRDIKK